jgi:ribose 5-phosphate isomerase B
MAPDAKLTESRIREKVRAVVYRTLGRVSETGPARRPIVTESDIQGLPFRGEFTPPAQALFTPLARQAMIERQIHLTGMGSPSPFSLSKESASERSRGPALSEASASERSRGPALSEESASGRSRRDRGPVAIGCDHAGFPLKENLKAYLVELGYGVLDCGASGVEPVDYPDFALAVAELVAGGRVERGVLIDGAGIGSSVAANKVPGVRAALCSDLATAVNSREHNDANVLTLGAGQIGAALARQIVRAFLETRFAGGRHARRVGKITEIERRYLRR